MTQDQELLKKVKITTFEVSGLISFVFFFCALMYFFPLSIREEYCGSAFKGEDVIEMAGYVQFEC